MSRAIGKQKQTWVDENGVEMKIRQQKKKRRTNEGRPSTEQRKNDYLSKETCSFFIFCLFICCFYSFRSSAVLFVFIEYAFCAFRIYDGLSTCDVVLFLIIFLLHSHAAFRMVVEATCVGNTFCLFLCLIFYLFSEQHQFHMAYDNIPNMNIPYDRRSFTTECPLSIQHQVYINIDFLSGWNFKEAHFRICSMSNTHRSTIRENFENSITI